MHLVHGDGDSADKHREFYDEYLAVMDLTAEFYLQTVDTVFVQHLMPRGLMTSRGRPVDLAAIRRPALMTVEGEKDDITGTGQCRAALDLCVGIPAEQQAALRMPEGRPLRHLQRLALPHRDRAAHGQVHARARSLRGIRPHHRAARAHGDDAAPWPPPQELEALAFSFAAEMTRARALSSAPAVACRHRAATCPHAPIRHRGCTHHNYLLGQHRGYSRVVAKRRRIRASHGVETFS